MKTLILLALISAGTLNLSAQTLTEFNSFFREGGAKMLSRLAHPTNDFIRASWNHYDGGERTVVTIISHDNWDGNDETTVITLYRSGYLFRGLQVDSDTDWPSAFSAVSLLKEMANEALEEYQIEGNSMINRAERLFNRTISEMSAKQLSCALFSAVFYAW
ncbi:MAG: hypothetical protein AAFY36_15210 [Bacteroidota bacterium]